MKKIYLFLMASFIATSAMLFSSCDDFTGDGSQDGSESLDGSLDSGKPVPTTPEEQKRRLEEVAISFSNEMAASNIQETADLAKYIKDTYVLGEFDNSKLYEWADSCLDAIASTFIGESEDTYGVPTKHYESLYKASNFKGRFEAKDNAWEYAEADDLSFTVKDGNGVSCILRLTTEGKTKTVHAFNDYNWDSIYDENGLWIGETKEEYEINIEIPEKIVLTLQQGTTVLVKFTLNTDLSSIKGDNFDVSKDQVNITSEFQFEDYSIKLEKLKYAPGAASTVKASFKKGSKTLIEGLLTAKVNASDEEIISSTDNMLDIIIMNEIRVKGNIAVDAVELQSKMDSAWYFDDNEEELKRLIDEVNPHLNIGLYYGDTDEPSAEFKYKATYRDYDYGYGEWYPAEAIVFDDGTSYIIEEFFNEEDFKQLLNTIDTMIKEYCELVGIEQEEEDYIENGGEIGGEIEY